VFNPLAADRRPSHDFLFAAGGVSVDVWAMAEIPVIDLQSIENLRELNPGDNDAFLREIIGIYLDDTPLRLTELDQGLATGDAAKFTRAAHSIKGSSANVGAMTVRSVAETLEHQSAQQGLANVTELIAALRTEYARAEAELRKLLPAS
jgi:HPt (histidine-containing phosphotransfer) domain-containing protein